MQKYLSHLLTLSFIFQYCKASKYDKLEPKPIYTFNSSIPFGNSTNITNLTDCIPSVIKINSKNEIFVSFPKYSENSTCPTFTKFIHNSTSIPHFLEWPNNNSSFISVTGFEIDKDDNFFVLDQGSKSLKILLSDGTLHQNVDLSGKINPNNSFLSDIILDTSNGYAFISDCISYSSSSLNEKPQLIIVNYTLKEKNSYEITSISNYKHDSFLPDKSYWLHINNAAVTKRQPIRIGLSTLAISCSFDYLYYSPLTSNKIYSVKIEDVFSNKKESVVEKYKGFASSSMLMSGNANLYLTDLDNSLIREYKQLTKMEEMNYKNILPINAKHVHLYQWPSSMAFGKEKLYYISNNYHSFINGEKLFAQILEINVTNERSYIRGCSYDDFSWSYKNIILWSVFSVLILIVLSFVLVSSNKQEESGEGKIDKEDLVD